MNGDKARALEIAFQPPPPLKRFIYFCLVCMSVMPSCMSVHHMLAVHRGQERISDPPRITDCCEPLCGCWKLNPGPLERAASVFIF